MKTFLITLVVAILFVAAFIFGSQNDQVVTINYLFAKGEFSLTFILGAVFIAGFLFTWIFAGFYIFSLKLKLRQANKTIAKSTKI